MSFILLIYRPGRSRKLFYFENDLFLSLFHNISRTNVFDLLWLKILLGKKVFIKLGLICFGLHPVLYCLDLSL